MPADRRVAPLPPLPRGVLAHAGLGLWRESRAPRELVALRRSAVWRRGAPAGDGQPVVLVPGFLAGASSMSVLRRWLTRAGYEVTMAAVGRNATSSAVAAAAVARAVGEATDASGRRVVLIGHSRGGQQARVTAGRTPERVALLVTLGAPVRRHLPPNLVVRVPIEAFRAASIVGLLGSSPPGEEERYERDLFSPFPSAVPWVTIWSRTDGVLDWQSCLHKGARSVEVRASHMGMVANAEVFGVLARVLAEAPWRGTASALP